MTKICILITLWIGLIIICEKLDRIALTLESMRPVQYIPGNGVLKDLKYASRKN